MNKKVLRWDFWTGITVLAMVVFGLFLIYPLFSLFVSAFQNADTGAFSLENFVRFFQRKYYYQSMINSFSVTACVTVLAIIIGTTLAYFMSLYKIRGKNIVEICIIISLLSPPFIGAYSWILIGGRSGILTTWLYDTFGYEFPSIYGFAGILLVLTLKLYPFIYLYVAGADLSQAGGIHGLPEEGEDIRVNVMSVNQALSAVERGRINNAPCILALQWLALNKPRLQARWKK